MKKIVFFLFLIVSLNATTFDELFNALKRHPQTKLNDIEVKKSKILKELIDSKLYYPKIDIFAKYEHTTKPLPLYPLTPNESSKLIKDPSKPQRFSKNIFTEGLSLNFPLYVKSLITLSDKLSFLQKSAKEKAKIELLKNMATIVVADANMLYLDQLKNSLSFKEKSLLKTKKIVKLKVENGRAAEAELYKIENRLNQVKIAKNGVEIQKEKLIDTIRRLTGFTLKEPIELPKYKFIDFNGDLFLLKPLIYKQKADELEIKAQKEKLYYPKISAYANFSFMQANAYNNDERIDKTFSKGGIVLTIPIYDKSQSKEIQKAKIEAIKSSVEIQKLKDELNSEAIMLKNSLPFLENSLTFAKKNVKNSLDLLKVAKKSYILGRMSIEEYLRYEDKVIEAKAEVFEIEAKIWQTLMKLAVIYGKNIEEIVK